MKNIPLALGEIKKQLLGFKKTYACTINSEDDYLEFTCEHLDVDIDFSRGECDLRIASQNDRPLAIYWGRSMTPDDQKKYLSLQQAVIDAYFSSRIGSYKKTRSYVLGLFKWQVSSLAIQSTDGTLHDISDNTLLPEETKVTYLIPKKA